MNKFIVLYGPTGVGKTDIGLHIASKIDAEIINMDVGQFYTPLSIGTAKPDWKNSVIPHHLFDCIDEPIHFSVVDYKSRVLEIMNDVWTRGKMPLLIGGSGFYLYALLFQIAGEKKYGIGDEQCYASWDDLRCIDESRAAQIHPNDRYRIARALQICRATRSPSSDFVPQLNPIAPCDIIFLNRDRTELYSRINQRTDSMFSTGLVQEVRALLGTPWEEFMLEKKLIGYNELISHLKQNNGAIDYASMHTVKEAMAQRTRRYAKRQNTFWRYLEKKLTLEQEDREAQCRGYTVHLTLHCDDNSMQKILNYIKN